MCTYRDLTPKLRRLSRVCLPPLLGTIAADGWLKMSAPGRIAVLVNQLRKGMNHEHHVCQSSV